MAFLGKLKHSISAEEYWKGTTPEDMEDAWVYRPGSTGLTEVWDVGIEKQDGKIVLYTQHAEPTLVDPEYLIFYS